jgi:hypothetical protein
MAGIRTLRGRAQAPYEGAFPAVQVRRERARNEPPRRAGAPAMRKGVDLIEAGRMITRLMTSENSSKEAGHKEPYISRPSRIPLIWLKMPETINDIFQYQTARVWFIILT